MTISLLRKEVNGFAPEKGAKISSSRIVRKALVFNGPIFRGTYILMGDDPKQAVLSFESLYEAVTVGKTDRSEIKPWEFPGLAVFALEDGFIVEESPATTISVLQKAFPYVNREKKSVYSFFAID